MIARQGSAVTVINDVSDIDHISVTKRHINSKLTGVVDDYECHIWYRGCIVLSDMEVQLERDF